MNAQQPEQLLFLLDVDNTLLDNDQIQRSKCSLDRSLRSRSVRPILEHSGTTANRAGLYRFSRGTTTLSRRIPSRPAHFRNVLISDRLSVRRPALSQGTRNCNSAQTSMGGDHILRR